MDIGYYMGIILEALVPKLLWITLSVALYL